MFVKTRNAFLEKTFLVVRVNDYWRIMDFFISSALWQMTTGIKGCARLSYLVIKSHAAHKFGARCRSICIFAVLIFGGRKHVGPRACLQEVSCAREPSGKTLIYWPLAVAHFIFSKFNAVNKIVKHHPGPKCSACNVCRRIMNSLSLSLYFFFTSSGRTRYFLWSP